MSVLVTLLIYDGPIGVNLQSLKHGKGGYIDDFYYGPNGEFYPAKLNGSLQVGDVMISINDKDVSTMALESIYNELSNAHRPMSIVFQRSEIQISLKSLLRDSRNSVWITCYLESLQFAETTQRVHMLTLFGMFDCIASLTCFPRCGSEVRRFILETLESRPFASVEFKIPTIIHHELIELRSDLERSNETVTDEAVFRVFRSLHGWLTESLNSAFLAPFLKSVEGKRLKGWLNDSPTVVHISAVDLLSNKTLWPYLYYFLALRHRHHKLHEFINSIPSSQFTAKTQPVHTENIEELAVEWIMDGTLLAFYSSDTYDQLLAALGVNTEDVTTRREALKITEFTLVDNNLSENVAIYLKQSAVNQFLRSAEWPAGFSKHVSSKRSSSESTCGAAFAVVHFDTVVNVIESDLHCVETTRSGDTSAHTPSALTPHCRAVRYEAVTSTGSQRDKPKQTVQLEATLNLLSCVTNSSTSEHTDDVSGKATHQSIVVKDSMLPFFVPTEDLLQHVSRYTSTITSSSKVFNFIITLKSGERLYGCSLVTYKPVTQSLQMEPHTRIHSLHKVAQFQSRTSTRNTADTTSYCNSSSSPTAMTLAEGSAVGKKDHRSHRRSLTAISSQVLSDVGSTLYSGMRTAAVIGSNLPIVPIFTDGPYIQPIVPNFTEASAAESTTNDAPSVNESATHRRMRSTASLLSNWSAAIESSVNTALANVIPHDSPVQQHNMRRQIAAPPSSLLHTALADSMATATVRTTLPINSVGSTPPLRVTPLNTTEAIERPAVSEVSITHSTPHVPSLYAACGVCILTRQPLTNSLRSTLTKAAAETPEDTDHTKVFETVTERLKVVQESKQSTIPPNLPDITPSVIFECLSPHTFVTVLLSAILEYKIIILSDFSVNFTMIFSEYIRHCITPLKYCHIYLPVLPQSTGLELLQCPTPYILGLCKSTVSPLLNDLPVDAVMVDVDCGSVTIPESVKVALKAGSRLESRLSQLLRPALHSLDSVQTAESNEGTTHSTTPATLCQQFVAELLRDVDKCCVTFDGNNSAGDVNEDVGKSEESVVLFDETVYLERKTARVSRRKRNEDVLLPPGQKEFVSTFLRSQCLSEYISDIDSRLCK